MPHFKTKKAVARFAQALGAEQYDIRVVDATDQNRHPIKVTYTQDQLISPGTLDFLALMNRDRFHIYCRPIGYEYVLLDDLSREKLIELSKLNPCLLIETSSSNFQAWLKLKEPPTEREIALRICKGLAEYFAADMNAAKPEQVGRLPGYTNCKEKYRKANGQFDYVLLRKSMDRYASLYPLGAACQTHWHELPKNVAKKRQTPATKLNNKSQSEIDFAIACQMIREGSNEVEIYSRLEQNLSLPGRTKKTRGYIRKTIEKARIAIAKSCY